jgi:DNA-binding SARP family transcriptional activator/class 3 adenylate cyclase
LLEFQVLGPFQVIKEGRPLPLGAYKQRALLALLLLERNHVVPRDRLVDALWGESPPASTTTSLHVYVSRLRRALAHVDREDGGVLVTQPPGYLLRAPADSVDGARFERLVAAGGDAIRAGKAVEAEEALARALGLWRGPALADFASEEFAQAEIARLERLRLRALEDRVEAFLLLGRHADALGELPALVERHPYEERPRAQLMLALYRSGRAAEALAVYRDFQQLLRDDLGLDPSLQLRELESGILRQDPALGPGVTFAAPAIATPADLAGSTASTEPLAGPGASRTERKTVTMLVAAVVHVADDRKDPEDVRARLEPFHRCFRQAVQRYGGTIEVVSGDAASAAFGAPTTHEDDPERAVRAAIRLRDWAVEDGRVRVRIGLDTGDAIVALDTRPRPGEAITTGEVVSVAMRAQTAAPTNGILVGERAYQLTEQVIDYREAEPIEPTRRVWEALRTRARLGVGVVDHAEAPLVGRERELALIESTLARVRETRSPQLVTLMGVPGIGKSRLVYELRQAVDKDPSVIITWRQGNSLPYGDGVSFWALAEIVKAQAGILETDADAAAEEKLSRAVHAISDEEAEWVTRHLRPLVGLGSDRELAAERRSEAFAAWRRFFEALADRRPLVLLFEDLQWADDGLLDFVDALVEWATGVPLLVMATARPELLERRPDWAGGKANAVTLSLSPLSDEETGRLLAHLLEQTVLPAETRSTLLINAGGNPLYAEQYVRMLSERGQLEELPLPETVHSIIAARLDALSPAEKSLLQSTAVFTNVFWSGAAAAVEGLDDSIAAAHLNALERKQVVQRARRSSVAGQSEYAFSHVLLRDVAYGQLPRAARAEKHERAAAWIESLGRPEDHAESTAHHYLAALEYTRAVGGNVGPFEERARVALRRAGERALALNAYTAAARFFGGALELSPADDERPTLLFCYGKALSRSASPDEGILVQARDSMLAAGDAERAAECQVIIGELLWRRGERERAFANLDQAIAMVERRPASYAKAYALSILSRFRSAADDPRPALEIARAAMAIAEELGLDDLRADALNTIGVTRVTTGDRGGLRDLERSIAIAEAANSPQSIRGYFNLGGMLANLGDLRRAAELHAKGDRLAERFGDAAYTEWFEAERVYQHYWSGEWDAAISLAEQLIARAEHGASRRPELDGCLVRGWIALARGDLAGAMAYTDRAGDFSRAAGDPQNLYPALALRARTLVAAGRRTEAAACADELLRLLGERPSLPSFWVLDLAIVLLALGRGSELGEVGARTPSTRWLEAARAYVEGEPGRAASICAEIGALSEEAYARLEAATVALVAGRRSDAEAELGRALDFYRRVRADAYCRRADELLAA